MSDLLASIIKTLVTTYDADHPRSRARRFYPFFAKVAYSAMMAIILAIAWVLFNSKLPFIDVVCMLYGILIIPLIGFGSWAISSILYEFSVFVLTCKDKVWPKGGNS